MKRLFKTVKARIIAMVLCFALAITTLVVSFSYYLIYEYQTRTSVQSAVSNLRLVSALIERDLIEVMALARWCYRSIDSYTPGRYLATSYDAVVAVESFNRLQNEYRNNRAYQYIRRIIVVSDTDNTRVLHTGRDSSNSTLAFLEAGAPSPIAHYEIEDLPRIYDIGQDPYFRGTSVVINILGPVMAPSSTRVVGTVYLAVDTALITDLLQGYSLPEGGTLYLTLGGNVYRFEGRELVLTEELGPITADGQGTAGEDTVVGTAEVARQGTLDAVSCEIRRDVYITQVFDRTRAMPSAESWLVLLIGVSVLILLLSLLVILMLNRTISRPVARIRSKMDAIAAGDFSHDAKIESDSEIGEVGRGINQLSRDVVGLMETRLADEQQKRELEYRMLQSQINPHFLYNTLGAIKWMATLQKAEGIAEMTTALSRLLKTVAKDLRKVVPLQDELALLDDYFLILRYRYGGAVTFEKDIEDEALQSCCLPRFVLQPLMENAIFHGIEPKGKGTIRLTVRREGADVLVSLRDDGVGLSTKALAALNTGEVERPHDGAFAAIGMRSVHQRVRNVFGAGYGLTAESEPGVYTEMTIRLPAGGGAAGENRKEG